MNPTVIQEITLLKEIFANENDFGIIVGAQSLDSYAAGLALFLSLKSSGKKAQIVSRKQPTVEVSGLVGIDKVKDSFTSSNTSKLVVALPYIKGEVEKVLFTEAPNTINFHLTAAAGQNITPFELSDVKLMWGEGGVPSVILAIGVGTLDDLSAVVDTNATKIVNIDNFSTNSRYGDVVLVDETFSSLSEISGKIIKDLQLSNEIDAAQNVLDGVLFATRNFTKPNTSPLAFEAASAAMYVGAQRKVEAQRAPQQQMPDRDRSQQRDMQGRGDQREQRDQRGQRDQRDQRDNRDQRGQQRDSRDQRAQQQPQQPQQRVNDNDFPAMHMQGGNRSQQQPRPQMSPRPQQSFGGQNRSFGNAQDKQNRPQQQPQQSFGASPSDIEELMRKIKEENAKRGQNRSFGNAQDKQNRPQQQPQQQPTFNQPLEEEELVMQPPIQDAQIVDENVMPEVTQPIEDATIVEESNFDNATQEEIPDDWLMPKVFKSSKNNN